MKTITDCILCMIVSVVLAVLNVVSVAIAIISHDWGWMTAAILVTFILADVAWGAYKRAKEYETILAVTLDKVSTYIIIRDGMEDIVSDTQDDNKDHKDGEDKAFS